MADVRREIRERRQQSVSQATVATVTQGNTSRKVGPTHSLERRGRLSADRTAVELIMTSPPTWWRTRDFFKLAAIPNFMR